ncbi:hypothetical protein [Aquimarina sp. RZ0]|uniref:hypothetical protein n=1 Tax=Aquimarina sp. RZ0 TaxID=2607730 RepID=UPI00165FEA73|nr:hypothetical protein [Aquimarina sp. RZ0]
MSKISKKRGEHNELEANQIQVSSLLVLTHFEKINENRKNQVIDELKKLNPMAKIVTMESLDVLLLPELLPSENTAQEFEHHRAHWSSCSIDLPILLTLKCIHDICQALPKSILRVKGCTTIGNEKEYTFFEHTPDGKVFIRPFNGVPITDSKLLTIGPGSEPSLLQKIFKTILLIDEANSNNIK